MYMDSNTDAVSPLLQVLKEHPRGMSVSDIAAAVGVNRNTVSRYLDILLVSGQVEMKAYGRAKVFYLSQRVPISAMLNFSSDLVLVLDRDRRIIQANDSVCEFAGVERDDIIGKNVAELQLAAFDHILIHDRVIEALNGDEVVEEIRFLQIADELYFRAKFLPTVFNDGTPGVTIILEDITEERRAEIALREREMLFRSLVENINDLILNVDENCAFTYISPKSREMLGYTPEEMLGRAPWEFTIPEKAGRIKAQLVALLANPKQKILSEWTMLHREGSSIILEVSGTPIYDTAGDFTGYRMVCRDVTDRVRATKRVTQWKSFLYSVVNNIPNMVFVQETQDNTFIFSNRAAEAFLGMTKEEMSGKQARELLPPEMVNIFTDKEDETVREMTIREEEVRLPGGQMLSMKKIPIFNSHSVLRYTLVIAEDITNRAEAEDRLVAERDRAQGYLDAAGVMIAVIDVDGTINLVNQRGNEILDYIEEDLTGRNWFSTVVPERLRNSLSQNYSRMISEGTKPPLYEEGVVVTRGGQERRVLWHNALLRDTNGEFVAMVISGEEVNG